LIVNLSDDLFDFDEATLNPDAREKLSKLAGILLAYPCAYRMQIEGHTYSVGSTDYNQKFFRRSRRGGPCLPDQCCPTGGKEGRRARLWHDQAHGHQ
jgi:hypothetical protein